MWVHALKISQMWEIVFLPHCLIAKFGMPLGLGARLLGSLCTVFQISSGEKYMFLV